jgi:hypothetical protein
MDQQNAQSHEHTWVCMGACQAVISQKEYDEGLTKCGAESCDMHGKPFVKGTKDEVTGKNVAEEEALPAGTS